MSIYLFTGSRTWHDVEAIEREFSKLPPESIIVNGGARGADFHANRVAHKHGFHVACMSPLWDIYPAKVAPLKRDEAMVRLAMGTARGALAFQRDGSPGTAYTIGLCEKAGLPVSVVTE